MEGVPRLPMLSFELKQSLDNPSFGPKIKQYIAEYYHEDPETYSSEIHQLEGLRSAAVRAATDDSGLDALKKYFCQLRFIQSRFPMAINQPAAVPFTWKDLFASITCTRADIRFEMLCILYNIAALHCKLGAMEPRVDQESMKIACTHFQTGVWIIQYIRDQYPQPPGVDLCPEIMKFFQDICLAQAQECILEKSMQDNRRSGIVASVAMQIIVHYKTALAVLETNHTNDSIHETIGSKVCNTWTKAITFKIAYISCLISIFQGTQAEENQKWGERVAFYESATEKLAEAKKIFKGMPQIPAIKEALSFVTDVVEGKKKAAKNENEFIYHEEVPAITALSEPRAAPLAKGLPINFHDPKMSGPDIFAKLVPMGAHEASSMYSEEKAKLLRKVVSESEFKNAKLDEFMSSLQLEHLNKMKDPERLPQDLVDRCASLSVKTDAIQNLIETMNNLADTHTDVENMLTEIKKLIQEEESNEKEYQKIMGPRPPSIVSTELSREANKYQEAHNRANDSNQTLHKAMTIHLANLKTLALPLDEIEAQIPSLKAIKDNIDEPALEEMRMLIDKVETMKSQRGQLITLLRDAINNDDITSQLLTRTGEPLDDIFKEEIEKHVKKVKIIEQNMIAQENILKALTDAYAKYAPSKKLIAEVIRKRESFLTGLISSYDTYEDLLSKSLKGLEFYKKLSTNVAKLLTRVRSTCKVQEEERSSLLANNASRQTYASEKVNTSSDYPVKKQQTFRKDDAISNAPKLKDYLPYMKTGNVDSSSTSSYLYPPYIRPAPVGSEGTNVETQNYDGQLNQTQYPVKSDHYTAQNVDGSSGNPYVAQYQYDPSYSQANSYTYTQPNPTGDNSMNYQYQQNPQAEVASYPVNYPTSSSGYSPAHMYDLANQMEHNMNISSGNQPPSYDANQTAMYNPALYGTTLSYPEQNQPEPVAASNHPSTAYNPYSNAAENSSTNAAVQNVSYPQYSTQTYSQEPVAANVDSSAQNYNYQGTNLYAQYDSNVQNYAYPATAESTPQYNYSNNPSANLQSNTAYSAENMYVASTPNQGYSTKDVPASVVPAQSYTPQPYEDQPIQSHVYAMSNSSSNSNLTATNSYSAPSPALPPMPESSIAQQYPGTYIPNQYANQTYQNHPGYSYNSSTGAYDYSYGYQNSNANTPQANIQGVNSQYTSAGSYATVQTNSSTATTPATENVSNQSPYYTVPYGNHQNVASETNGKVESSENQPMIVQNNTVYIRSQKSDTTTTESSQGKQALKSSPSVEEKKETVKEPSAIDLLSGLDFSIEQQPLMPEIKVPSVSEHVIRRSVIVREKDVSILDEPDSKAKEETKPPKKDMYSDPSLLNTFTQEVKNLQGFVDSFTKKTHSGITMLDSKWKKIQDAQSKESKSCEIAKNNMDKNASPDVYPYDDTRVTFKYDTENSYINASHVKQISSWSIPMIVSDLPKEEYFKQFWTMIYQQKINVIVCLLTDIEMNGKFYWPAAKNLDLKVSPDMSISLDEITCNVNWTERVFTLKNKEDHVKISHYQINMFPARVVSAPLVLLVDKVLRGNPEPNALIHCSTGSGRSALIVILTMVMCQVRAGQVELREMLDAGIRYLCGTRTNVLEDTKYLVDIYRTVLFYVQGVLCSGTVNFNGESVSFPSGPTVSSSPIPPGSRKHSTENLNKFTKESFEEMKQAAGLKSGDMKDPLSYLDPLWSLKKRKE